MSTKRNVTGAAIRAASRHSTPYLGRICGHADDRSCLQARGIPYILPLALLVSGCLRAQAPAVQTQRSMLLAVSNTSSSGLASGEYSPPQTLIENRARTLGNTATSGSGSRYFFACDASLMGKTADEALRSLSPAPITVQDHVRSLFVLIDLRQPWKLVTTGPANVGTATVDSRVPQLQVNTSIFANSGLTVMSK
jgi:hypothetical protein